MTSSTIQELARLGRNANLVAVLAFTGAHARRLVRLRVDQHDLRDVDRQLFFDDAALRQLLSRLGVALDAADTLDDDAVAIDQDLEDLAARALVLARDHDDVVVFAQALHQTTSGASEMIFMNFLARS